MDDKNPRIDSDRTAGRGAEDLTGRAADRDWESTTRVPATDVTSASEIYGTPATPAYRAPAGTSRTDFGTTATTGSGGYDVAGGNDDDSGENQRTRQIRAEIEETRGEMTETVNAIQERLRPANIASNAADSVKEAAVNAAGTVREAAVSAAGNISAVASDKARDVADSEPARYVRANPAQSAMLAVGIGGLMWMLFGTRRAARRRPLRTVRPSNAMYSRTEEYGLGDTRTQYDSRTEYGGGTQYGGGAEYGQGGYSSTRSMASGRGRGSESWSDTDQWGGASGIADQASRTAEDVQRRTRETARRAQSQVQRAWNDNPLLIGAAAAIVGAIVGAAMPETDRENEWLGETRDSMVGDVQQTVRETVSKVQNVATAAVGLVTDQAGQSGQSGQSGQMGGQSQPASANESGEGSSTPSSQPPSWQAPGGSGGVV
jgi:ElaB/YqjD/DUF883 family membrane-anchored ribosome-binding protein